MTEPTSHNQIQDLPTTVVEEKQSEPTTHPTPSSHSPTKGHHNYGNSSVITTSNSNPNQGISQPTTNVTNYNAVNSVTPNENNQPSPTNSVHFESLPPMSGQSSSSSSASSSTASSASNSARSSISLSEEAVRIIRAGAVDHHHSNGNSSTSATITKTTTTITNDNKQMGVVGDPPPSYQSVRNSESLGDHRATGDVLVFQRLCTSILVEGTLAKDRLVNLKKYGKCFLGNYYLLIHRSRVYSYNTDVNGHL